MKHIKELDGLRGLMALWVVFGHVFATLPAIKHIPPNLMNTTAVDVFIILSGFVIFFMIDDRKQEYLPYITQRFFRIFPIYLVALIISLAMIGFSRGVIQALPSSPSTIMRLTLISDYFNNPVTALLSHLPLLQGAIPPSILTHSSYLILGQAWSVSVEWQFYIIAPLLFYIITNIDKKTYTILAIIFVLSLLFISRKMGKGFYGENIISFSIGYLSFFFYKHVYPKVKIIHTRYIFSIFALSSILVLKQDSVACLIWTISFYYILKFQSGYGDGLVNKLLSNPRLIFLGKISYSVYMTHMIILYIVFYFVGRYSGIHSYTYLLAPLLVVSLTIIVSIFTYSFIEKPMIKFGKKLSNPQTVAME